MLRCLVFFIGEQCTNTDVRYFESTGTHFSEDFSLIFEFMEFVASLWIIHLTCTVTHDRVKPEMQFFCHQHNSKGYSNLVRNMITPIRVLCDSQGAKIGLRGICWVIVHGGRGRYIALNTVMKAL